MTAALRSAGTFVSVSGRDVAVDVYPSQRMASTLRDLGDEVQPSEGCWSQVLVQRTNRQRAGIPWSGSSRSYTSTDYFLNLVDLNDWFFFAI